MVLKMFHVRNIRVKSFGQQTAFAKVFSKISKLFQLSHEMLDAKSERPIIKGVIFDMDGTLTIPCLDFKKLKQELKIPLTRDILEYVSELPENQKLSAFKIIEDFETDGRKNLKLQPGIQELFKFLLQDTNLKVGLITRNDQTSVDHFLCKFKAEHNSLFDDNSSPFSIMLTREFKPVKPDPASVFHICSEWNIKPENIIVVGDDVKDIDCGKNAGTFTILVNNTSNNSAKAKASFNIDSLPEIIHLLRNNFAVVTSYDSQTTDR